MVSGGRISRFDRRECRDMPPSGVPTYVIDGNVLAALFGFMFMYVSAVGVLHLQDRAVHAKDRENIALLRQSHELSLARINRFLDIYEANALKSFINVTNPLSSEQLRWLQEADDDPRGLRCLDDEQLESLNQTLDEERRSGKLDPVRQGHADFLVARLQEIKAEREFLSSLASAIDAGKMQQVRRHQ